MSLKLYAVVLGARIDNHLLEQHKIIFVVCEDLDEMINKTKESWKDTEHLHIDVYMYIKQIDGHEVLIQDNHSTQIELSAEDDVKELFFVNLGGYKNGAPNELPSEMHKQIFVVATSPEEAKELAKQDVFFKDKDLLREEDRKPHVDDVISVNEILKQQGYTIKLRNQNSKAVITGFLRI